MLIGELSSKSGFSRDAIRFYEKQGLLRLSRKQRRGNNYKEYPDVFLGTLLTIRRLKNFGFTLQEISELLAMVDVKMATCLNVEGMIREKVALLDNRILDMMTLRNQLLDSARQCKEGCVPQMTDDNCPILVSEIL